MSERQISYTKARKFLRSCDWRMSRTVINGDDETTVDVFYEGKWLKLGRIDDGGDVGEFVDWSSDPQFFKNPPMYFRKTCLLGAVITDTEFFVIDSATDG